MICIRNKLSKFYANFMDMSDRLGIKPSYSKRLWYDQQKPGVNILLKMIKDTKGKITPEVFYKKEIEAAKKGE